MDDTDLQKNKMLKLFNLERDEETKESLEYSYSKWKNREDCFEKCAYYLDVGLFLLMGCRSSYS